MVDLAPPLRSGQFCDAAKLAELVNYAGEGFPLYLWDTLAAADQDPWDIGRQRAMRETGGFSYKNAFVIEADDQAAGCLIGYEIADVVEPIPDDMPALFRPLQELENLAPGSWYVNVLAILPDYRGQGLGTKLLKLADALGQEAGKPLMSVIVSDSNTGARQLYERCGYAQIGSRPMVKEDWVNDGQNWVLLTKRL